MFNEPVAKFEIAKEMIEPIIKAQIQAAIVSGLGGEAQKAKMIDAIVMAAIDRKVNEHGNVDQYSSNNKYTYVEAVSGVLIREAVTLAVREWLEKAKPQIIASLEKQLMKNKNRMAAKMVESLIDTSHSSLNIKLEINEQRY